MSYEQSLKNLKHQKTKTQQPIKNNYLNELNNYKREAGIIKLKRVGNIYV